MDVDNMTLEWIRLACACVGLVAALIAACVHLRTGRGAPLAVAGGIAYATAMVWVWLGWLTTERNGGMIFMAGPSVPPITSGSMILLGVVITLVAMGAVVLAAWLNSVPPKVRTWLRGRPGKGRRLLAWARNKG